MPTEDFKVTKNVIDRAIRERPKTVLVPFSPEVTSRKYKKQQKYSHALISNGYKFFDNHKENWDRFYRLPDKRDEAEIVASVNPLTPYADLWYGEEQRLYFIREGDEYAVYYSRAGSPNSGIRSEEDMALHPLDENTLFSSNYITPDTSKWERTIDLFRDKPSFIMNVGHAELHKHVHKSLVRETDSGDKFFIHPVTAFWVVTPHTLFDSPKVTNSDFLQAFNSTPQLNHLEEVRPPSEAYDSFESANRLLTELNNSLISESFWWDYSLPN
tara:strand:+ start:504 stop:1316 length:813 start_codon:yes stop_codon:yes gene_type:complete